MRLLFFVIFATLFAMAMSGQCSPTCIRKCQALEGCFLVDDFKSHCECLCPEGRGMISPNRAYRCQTEFF
ncbi:uncharacterized protein CELE_K12B6.11 [Caenorhabditis elegans]|uniref:Secreted protein n=1 Tax=Caenorhabditis elegans TaxID=6239 RepID=D6VP94_CAEEL|nr:Secreted protein [Caenorhabditis elegans]CCD70376.1 Secreted protein [Caenorhabditis elegans]|eukprot:NP_001256065.1 Uncharacterized protein CELE_K12B6.11 [Caenorhabditis elegans]